MARPFGPPHTDLPSIAPTPIAQYSNSSCACTCPRASRPPTGTTAFLRPVSVFAIRLLSGAYLYVSPFGSCQNPIVDIARIARRRSAIRRRIQRNIEARQRRKPRRRSSASYCQSHRKDRIDSTPFPLPCQHSPAGESNRIDTRLLRRKRYPAAARVCHRSRSWNTDSCG